MCSVMWIGLGCVSWDVQCYVDWVGLTGCAVMWIGLGCVSWDVQCSVDWVMVGPAGCAV